MFKSHKNHLYCKQKDNNCQNRNFVPLPAPTAPTPVPVTISEYHPFDPDEMIQHCKNTHDNQCMKEIPSSGISTEFGSSIIDQINPSWMDNDDYLRDLHVCHQAIAKEDGYFLSNNRRIQAFNPESRTKGIMHAIPFSVDTENRKVNSATAGIVCTENGGIRYVDCKDNVVIDHGPVTEACIVGNYDNAYGIYIPFNNTKAMRDGLALTAQLFDEFTKNDRDLY